MAKRQLPGEIVSRKMTETAVVKVERLKKHPKYQRRYKVSKRYQAQLKDDDFKVGDRVIIEECPPISKDKRWRVIGKVK